MECTKAALGLRLFMVLAAEGEAALARYIEGRADFARQAAERIRRQPGFEVAVEPESNIVCFRAPGSDEHRWTCAAGCWSGAGTTSQPRPSAAGAGCASPR